MNLVFSSFVILFFARRNVDVAAKDIWINGIFCHPTCVIPVTCQNELLFTVKDVSQIDFVECKVEDHSCKDDVELHYRKADGSKIIVRFHRNGVEKKCPLRCIVSSLDVRIEAYFQLAIAHNNTNDHLRMERIRHIKIGPDECTQTCILTVQKMQTLLITSNAMPPVDTVVCDTCEQFRIFASGTSLVIEYKENVNFAGPCIVKCTVYHPSRNVFLKVYIQLDASLRRDSPSTGSFVYVNGVECVLECKATLDPGNVVTIYPSRADFKSTDCSPTCSFLLSDLKQLIAYEIKIKTPGKAQTCRFQCFIKKSNGGLAIVNFDLIITEHDTNSGIPFSFDN